LRAGPPADVGRPRAAGGELARLRPQRARKLVRAPLARGAALGLLAGVRDRGGLQEGAGGPGAENVIPSTDCGFATVATHNLVDQRIAWAKLAAMSEGAAIAAARLAG
jgi:hypothetical protein